MKYMEDEIKQSSELKKFQKYYSHNHIDRIVLIGYSWGYLQPSKGRTNIITSKQH